MTEKAYKQKLLILHKLKREERSIVSAISELQAMKNMLKVEELALMSELRERAIHSVRTETDEIKLNLSVSAASSRAPSALSAAVLSPPAASGVPFSTAAASAEGQMISPEPAPLTTEDMLRQLDLEPPRATHGDFDDEEEEDSDSECDDGAGGRS